MSTDIQPMEQSGTSQNITWYAERGRRADYLWAEVVRNDRKRTGRGPVVPRSVPTFAIEVRRDPNQPVTRFTYEPARRPAAERLSPVTVTRLVRRELLARLQATTR